MYQPNGQRTQEGSRSGRPDGHQWPLIEWRDDDSRQTQSPIPRHTPQSSMFSNEWENMRSIVQSGRAEPTPSTVIWGDTASNNSFNINLQPAQKPRKLTELTYQSLRIFLTEFRQYHLESKGQATLHGHISDKIVTVIDTILGANRKYAYLLGHGHSVCVPDLTE